MNIRQGRGNSNLASEGFPYIVPASQGIFLAVEMFVPATDRRGLGTAKERPCYAHQRASPRRHRHCGGCL